MNQNLFSFQLNKLLPIPLYYQLKQGLIDLMDKNMLLPGTLLPSEREFSEAYDISRMTVRQAINELESEGRVYRIRGKGTYVSEKKVSQRVSKLVSFSAMMRSQGLNPSSYVHSYDTFKANSVLQEALQLSSEDDVLLVERIRLADDRPMVIERTFLPAVRFDKIKPEILNNHSLYDLLLSHYGIKPSRAVESIEAALADARDAQLLGMKENMPVLIRKQITYDQFGKPFEYVHAAYRGDRYKLVVDSEE